MCVKILPPLFLFTLITFSAFSQIRFEKGYFIDNQDNRTECLIRNMGWDNNPDSFRYKLPAGEEVLSAGIADVREFGVEGEFTYIRQEVKVDMSPVDLKLLSRDRNPMWETRKVFLNKIIEGEGKLFLLKDGAIRQYYIQKGGGEITPLVFKRFFNSDNQVQTNYGFRQQLLNELKCESLTQQYVVRLNYVESDLVKYFEKYHSCQNPAYQNKQLVPASSIVRLKWKPGLDVSMLSTRKFTFMQDGNRRGNRISFRMGAEIEYVAAFNQNKWALVLDPSVQYHKFPLRTNVSVMDINYWSVDAPVGIRHYLYLSGKNSFFLNALYAIKIANNDLTGKNREIRTGSNGAVGAGFAVRNFSLEARYYLKRFIESSSINVDAEYTKLSLIVGYTFFSK